MNGENDNGLRYHSDEVLFRTAVQYTAAETGFSGELIEKDYYCSVLLDYLARTVPVLVFRGGTCLAKVHLGFYRLSEDLDFSVSMESDAPRSERREAVAPFKDALGSLSDRLKGVEILEPVVGANNSTQYVAAVGYGSVITGATARIKIEVGLREKLLLDPVRQPARTLLRDPVTDSAVVPGFPITVMSRQEVFAEKSRAALSRRDVAIRDFYDLQRCAAEQLVDLRSRDFTDLVRKKLSVPGNDLAGISDERMATLGNQVVTDLKPVLRSEDFESFDLTSAIDLVQGIAAAIEGPVS